MKRAILCLALIFAAAGLAACSAVPDLRFAEKITVHYKLDAQTSGTAVIAEDQEIAEIVAALTTGTSNGSGNCEFTLLELVLEGRGKTVSVYPTPESCGTVRVDKGRSYYLLSVENREHLFDILAKHNIIFNVA